jgi:hypothetical protein
MRRADDRGAAVRWRDPALLGLVVLAALLRIPPAFGDLWLDEVWTILEAADLHSPLGVFTRFPLDNNHHLNTLVAYCLGVGAHPVLYRLHSLAAGIASVALAWDIGRFRGRSTAVVAATLTATSYVLIHFSSEARGYALLVFFALATWDAAWRFGRHPGWRSAMAVWVCAPLGFLSHLTYFYVFLASSVWLVIHLYRQGAQLRRALAGALWCFGLPVASLVTLYLAIFRHIAIGGGNPDTLGTVLVRVLSYAAGGPGAGPWATGVAVLGGGTLLASIWWVRRAAGDDWVFYALATIGAPAVVLLALRPDVLAVQYFVVNIAVGLLAVSLLAGALWDRGGWVAAGAAALLVLHIGGDAVNVLRLFRLGRGAYREGVRYMAAHTPGQAITVTSDHDFRNGTILAYYERTLPGGKRFEYIPQARQFPVEAVDDAALGSSPAGAAWMLFHRIAPERGVVPRIADRNGTTYALVKTLPYADLAGWEWYIYAKRLPGS